MRRAQDRDVHPLAAKHRSMTEQHPELHVAAETVPQKVVVAAADVAAGREAASLLVAVEELLVVAAEASAEALPAAPVLVVALAEADFCTASEIWLSTKSVTCSADPWLGAALVVKSRLSVGVTPLVAGNVSVTAVGVTVDVATGAPELLRTATVATPPETVPVDVSGTPLTSILCVTEDGGEGGGGGEGGVVGAGVASVAVGSPDKVRWWFCL